MDQKSLTSSSDTSVTPPECERVRVLFVSAGAVFPIYIEREEVDRYIDDDFDEDEVSALFTAAWSYGQLDQHGVTAHRERFREILAQCIAISRADSGEGHHRHYLVRVEKEREKLVVDIAGAYDPAKLAATLESTALECMRPSDGPDDHTPHDQRTLH